MPRGHSIDLITFMYMTGWHQLYKDGRASMLAPHPKCNVWNTSTCKVYVLPSTCDRDVVGNAQHSSNARDPRGQERPHRPMRIGRPRCLGLHQVPERVDHCKLGLLRRLQLNDLIPEPLAEVMKPLTLLLL